MLISIVVVFVVLCVALSELLKQQRQSGGEVDQLGTRRGFSPLLNNGSYGPEDTREREERVTLFHKKKKRSWTWEMSFFIFHESKAVFRK